MSNCYACHDALVGRSPPPGQDEPFGHRWNDSRIALSLADPRRCGGEWARTDLRRPKITTSAWAAHELDETRTRWIQSYLASAALRRLASVPSCTAVRHVHLHTGNDGIDGHPVGSGATPLAAASLSRAPRPCAARQYSWPRAWTGRRRAAGTGLDRGGSGGCRSCALASMLLHGRRTGYRDSARCTAASRCLPCQPIYLHVNVAIIAAGGICVGFFRPVGTSTYRRAKCETCPVLNA